MTTSSWSMAISFPVALIGVIMMLAAIWFATVNIRKHRGLKGCVALEILRVIIVAILIVTLFKPERTHRSHEVSKPLIAILSDASGSMKTRDIVTKDTELISREAWLKQQHESGIYKVLEENSEVVLEEFSSPSNSASSNPGTDINLALDTVLKNYSNLRAVLLLTDGDWNMGKSPVAAATKLRLRNVPVFAVAAGSDTFLPDLELKSVAAPAYGMMDEHISLPFYVQSRLPRDVKTTITLRSRFNGTITKDIVIPAMSQFHDTILLTPKREGKHTFTLKFPAEKEEVNLENNSKSFEMALRNEVLNVLVIESRPRWEYRFLHNALSRDPGVKVSCLLLHPNMMPGEGRNYISKFPTTREELSEYDVIFVGDIGIGPKALTKENAEMIKGLVEQQGSGVVFMPGELGNQASLVDSPLGDVMPVELNKARPGGFASQFESHFSMTIKGKDHFLTMLASSPSVNYRTWKGLPGFYWYAPVDRAKHGTEILGVHSVARNQHGRIPLLVIGSYGNGKTLFMGTDSAWRWRRGVEDTYHYRFWGQVVRWMAHQRHLSNKDGIRFFYRPEAPLLGEKVFLHATVFDKSGYPLKSGSVDVKISSESGKSEQLEMTHEPGGWGVFTGEFSAMEGGRHDIAVRCSVENRSIDTHIMVSSPEREKTGRPAKIGTLKEIVAITSGQFGTTDEFDKILKQITLLPEPEPIERRMRLWCHPLWAVMLVGLLSMYWAGRKLLGLL